MNLTNTNIFSIAAVLVIFGFSAYSIRRAGGISAVVKNFINLVNGVESAWLNFAAALIPYGVSLIPATLTFQHAMSELNFNFWTALDAGIVVELFGVVAMNTLVKFWQNNKKYTSDKSEKRAPLGLAIFSYSFYLAIVLIVNVVLEIIAGTRSFWGIVAIGLFSLLGVPSGVQIAIRAQHREALEQSQRPVTGNQSSGGNNHPAQSNPRTPKPASHYHDKIVEMTASIHASTGQLPTPKMITEKLGLDHDKSKGYVSTTISKWASDNKVVKQTTKPPFP